jgi:type I restriction enzyme S subunit
MAAPTRTLGEVAKFIRGVTFTPDDVVTNGTSGSVRCMRTKNVQKELDFSDVWSISSKFVGRDAQYLRAGDTLVSSANSWNLVGKCCWVPELDWPTAFGGFISVLRSTTADVFARYLFYWFSSPEIQATVRSYGRQTTNISNLDFTRCLALKIPVPPPEDQRWIAAALDAVDAQRSRRRKSLSLLESLVESIFAEMFGDVISNSYGWDASKTLGEIAQVTSGITKGRAATGPLETVPYMTVLNVQDKRLDLSTVKEIAATSREIERFLLRRDDLLLTEGGDPDKLGRGTLWRDEIPQCIHQNHIFRVRIDEGSDIHPVYLNWLVSSELGRRYFLRSAKQTTGIATINATQLRQFPLLKPPPRLQQQFAERLDKITELKLRQQKHLGGLNELFASLQHRVFIGAW